ncbi:MULTISPECIES: exopolysaccharide biosynthesis polyprenyl glycosylphosphotransferase [unclassified Streptomyces]|uniref:exopolysaccharide biosynthesis polyprenyl glycosylphosphotransferase n=1 Tax=unclassified Streptomyces TaxID=2593676 RepID=UPI000369D327|nr:exopolysaccharide biosynthesis polyprenyl glycosylphosphotransferase [Streptomyces sp. HmicA12]
MTQERIASSPGRQLARDEPGASATVIAQRTAHTTRNTLVGGSAQDHSSRALLLATDCMAALLGTVVLAPLQRHPLLVAGFVVLVLALYRNAGLYRLVHERYMLDDCPAVAARTAAAWCVLAAVSASAPPLQQISPRAVLSGAAAQVVLALLGRALVHRRRRTALVRRPCTALLVGPEATALRVASALQRHPASGIRLVGIVSDGAHEHQPVDGAAGADVDADDARPALPVLTTLGDMRRAVIQNGVRRAIVLGSSSAPRNQAWLRSLSELHCDIWELEPEPSPYVPQDRKAVRHLAGFRCRPVVAPPFALHPGKRALDLAVSALLLVLAGPVLLTCALWLRISEGRGVVFRQERIGKDGRPFTLLKFRTHRPADPIESATRWSVANEHHMPWFCRFLRRTSLDELLQLWNVFRGDMSLVGPRPERPYFVVKFGESYPGYSARHRMPTGITGLAQINGLRGDTSIEDRCRFDNAYIDNWSLWQDISILMRTASEFFRPTGS